MRNSSRPIRSPRWLPLLFALLATGVVVAQEGDRKTFRLPSGIQISVPATWVVSNEEQLRALEKARDERLAEKGITPPVTGDMANVPFQAEAARKPGALGVLVTVMPAELSQEELGTWSADMVRELGTLLAESQKKTLVASGMRDVSVGPSSLVNAGGKKAFYFTMNFTASDHRPYTAENYFIYTDTRTVVYSTQVGADQLAATAEERRRILESLRIE